MTEISRRRLVGSVPAVAAATVAGGLLPVGTRQAAADPDPQGHGPKTVDRSFTKVRYYWESFEDGERTTPPPGWSANRENMDDFDPDWRGWSFPGYAEFINFGGARYGFARCCNSRIAVIDSARRGQPDGNAPFSAALTSPEISVPSGQTLELGFDSHYVQAPDPQHAVVTAQFDRGDAQTLLTYSTKATDANAGGNVVSKREILTFTVPAGARTVRFTWAYQQQVKKGYWLGDEYFWAIDNVEVTSALPAPGKPVAILDIFSDVQGTDGNNRMQNLTLPFLSSLPDPAQALVINGDIVRNGTISEYETFNAAFAAGGGHPGDTLWNAGNHEYGAMDLPNGIDEAALLKRFLHYAGRTTPQLEYLLNGKIPLLLLSDEHVYQGVNHQPDGRRLVRLFSAQQLSWLEQRFDYWRARNTPVLFFMHQPLSFTVSGTYLRNYCGEMDRESGYALRRLLAANPNVVMFTSHTHWGLHLDDWAAVDHGLLPADDPRAREVNARGIPMFNTGAHCNEYTGAGNINGDVESDSVEHIPSGLRVYIHRDRVRVEAWNFGTKVKYHTVEIPVPAAYAAGHDTH
ncbi:hypothetical protein ORV05_15195 [Amycolatopsis cynarae]|uniref:Uncharacterized protein n=1 Tax=Amycolatopsis cynarae TaxID=2995223 RepID=A0ABY7B9M0_9PSEU|nr:hypothetical protein [Amycolatopsis sp. HUAS 11-8]WAL69055.1 hypothetical protein ORV05_15195 [Amycolatopsis sp. HUAS 11-8]